MIELKVIIDPSRNNKQLREIGRRRLVIFL